MSKCVLTFDGESSLKKIKKSTKMKNVILIVAFLLLPFNVSAFGVAEVTEVISVVRIGVSLVEYIYKVFSSILVIR